MFTGIIEEIGYVKRINQQSRSAQIEIKADKVLGDVAVGDSIAVNGVCLTVVAFDSQHFTADVMPETVSKTNLRELKPGSPVNLERALKLGGRLGGHIVQGHVDAVGTIVEKQILEIAIIYRIATEPELLQYVVPKGSVAIDGISLTVVDVFQDSFTVSLIPHTAHETVLGEKKPGDRVNLESDIIGRYVKHLMNRNHGEERQALNLSFLAEHGFI
ncbi:MAG: riboflavin synthase [Syntrophomonadaceae bacterium]|nr:riboflavin synthase [Bacillota bacterium]NLM89476.1 riboflavin synthase [Syntrophomonadaceae bacterium]HAA08949.1 riboflavin synthase [Syntrophomonas sp.]HQA50318.1 riboflavin synthase [Syntrophomonadaceae bacterium]HQD90263.1 riboflavin synthase [Syntrophomonadaceae bacterium]